MPKVECLMPTMPNRAELRAKAIESLQAQVYPADWDVTVQQDIDPGTLGAKLNRMIEKSDAEYFVLTDDDDWHSALRVQRQVQPLLEGYDMSGTSKIYYKDSRSNEMWLYSGSPDRWLGGMAFKRTMWELLKFENTSNGPDLRWQNALRKRAKFYDLADPALLIATIHDSNTCKKHTNGKEWTLEWTGVR